MTQRPLICGPELLTMLPGQGECLHTGSLTCIWLLTLLFYKPMLEAKIILEGQRNRKHLLVCRGGVRRHRHVGLPRVPLSSTRRHSQTRVANPAQALWAAWASSPGVPRTQRNLKPRRNVLLSSPNESIIQKIHFY